MFVLLCYNKQFIDRIYLILLEHKGLTLQIPISNIRYDLEPVPSISHVLYFPRSSFTTYVHAPSLHISCFSLQFSNRILVSYKINHSVFVWFRLFCYTQTLCCSLCCSWLTYKTLLGYDTMRTGTRFHIPEDKNFYDF